MGVRELLGISEELTSISIFFTLFRMGTNYYARYSPCKACGRYFTEKHIGKQSGGWRFLFQSYHDISPFEDWKKELSQPHIEIFNEYGEKVSLDYLLSLINQTNQWKDQLDNGYCYRDSDGYNLSHTDFS